MMRLFITTILLCNFGNSFAISDYFKQMDREDQDRLERQCLLTRSEDAKIHALEYSAKYSELIEELKRKYPNLDFINPCGL